MKRFISQFTQNMIIIIRNHFHWIILLTMAMIIGVYYAVPEQVDSQVQTYFYDATENKNIETFLSTNGMEEYVGFQSEEQLIDYVGSNRTHVGVIYDVQDEQRVVKLVHNGNLDPKTHNLYNLVAEIMLLYQQGEISEFSYELITLDNEEYNMTVRDLLLPILESFEVMILGFMLVAVTMFQEKEEGSIRAYRVSPAGVWSYLLSKAGVWVFLSLIYGTVVVMATHGFHVNWIGLIGLIIVGSYFMTILGICVAVFFDSMSEWFFVAIFLLVINMLPQVSLANPAFSPGWIKLLPSYPILFAVKNAIFGSGEVGYIWRTIALIAGEGVVITLIAYWLVKKKMMKEAS